MVNDNLLLRMRQTHVLQQRYRFTLAELNAMPPWEFQARCELIMIDQEEEKAQATKGR